MSKAIELTHALTDDETAGRKNRFLSMSEIAQREEISLMTKLTLLGLRCGWLGAKWTMLLGTVLASFIFVAVKTTRTYEVVSAEVTTKVMGWRYEISSYLSPKQEVKLDDVSSFEDVSLRHINEQAALKYRMDPAVGLGMIQHEAVYMPMRMRFEQGWKNQYAKKKGWEREGWMVNEEEYNTLFTSYGLMQIGYGLWRKTCNLKQYTDLYDPATNIDCGYKIMRECLDKYPQMPGGERIRQCLAEFNGGPEPSQKAWGYANEVWAKITNHLTQDFNPVLDAKTQQVALNR